MAYRLSDAAQRDVDHMVYSGTAEYGVDAAIAYHARIERCCEFLSEHPFAARLRNEVRPPVRAYPCQSHVIIYEIDDANNILIVRVCYGREDWLDL